MSKNIVSGLKFICDRDFSGNRTRFAKALGVSPQSMSQWLSGVSKPSEPGEIAFARYLNRDVQELRVSDDFLQENDQSVAYRLSKLERAFEEFQRGQSQTKESINQLIELLGDDEDLIFEVLQIVQTIKKRMPG